MYAKVAVRFVISFQYPDHRERSRPCGIDFVAPANKRSWRNGHPVRAVAGNFRIGQRCAVPDCRSVYENVDTAILQECLQQVRCHYGERRALAVDIVEKFDNIFGNIVADSKLFLNGFEA